MSVTSIVIPTFNGLPLLVSCVESIRSYTDTPYEIIVVDNGSRDGTLEYCRKQKLLFISLPSNVGFPIACNLGMSAASGDQILLLNNDVIVSKGWMTNMLNALYSEDNIGIVGPVINKVSGVQQVDCQYTDIRHFQKLANKWNVPDKSKWQLVERIVGVCFLFRRALMDTIGLLDERFSPGHYEDDDYCYRARSHGYKLLVCGDVLIHHEGSASFKQNNPDGWQNLIDRNHQQFIDKWHIDPHQFILPLKGEKGEMDLENILPL